MAQYAALLMSLPTAPSPYNVSLSAILWILWLATGASTTHSIKQDWVSCSLKLWSIVPVFQRACRETEAIAAFGFIMFVFRKSFFEDLIRPVLTKMMSSFLIYCSCDHSRSQRWKSWKIRMGGLNSELECGFATRQHRALDQRLQDWHPRWSSSTSLPSSCGTC